MTEHSTHQYFSTLNQFQLIQTATLGKGSFGSVVLGMHVHTSKIYAIKIIDLASINTEIGATALQLETSIHSILDHPHIVKLWEIFQENNKIYLIMEYVENGNLFYYQNTKKIFKQSEASIFFSQTLSAVEYLHKNNYLHRDLKPQNLLLDRDLNIKICDFGWIADDIHEKRRTFCGTYEYMAPEMIFDKQYDYRVDIWALGILLYELLHGFAPFQGQTAKQVRNQMLKGELEIDPNLSQPAQDLIFKILKLDPTQRLSIEEIKNHEWFTQNAKQKIKQFLGYENKMKYIGNNEKKKKIYQIIQEEKDKKTIDIKFQHEKQIKGNQEYNNRQINERLKLQSLKDEIRTSRKINSEKKFTDQNLTLCSQQNQNLQQKASPPKNNKREPKGESENKENKDITKFILTPKSKKSKKSVKTLKQQSGIKLPIYNQHDQKKKHKLLINGHRSQNSDITVARYGHQMKIKKQSRLKTDNSCTEFRAQPQLQKNSNTSNPYSKNMLTRYHTQVGDHNIYSPFKHGCLNNMPNFGKKREKQDGKNGKFKNNVQNNSQCNKISITNKSKQLESRNLNTSSSINYLRKSID